MWGVMGVLSYGIGTIVGLILVGLMLFWFVQDVTQKKHTVLRNYPVIGRLRYFFEKQGEYFCQYFFAGDRDEMPFNIAPAGPGYTGWPRTSAASLASTPPTTCVSQARSFLSTRPFRCWRKTACPRRRF